jgi:hypothetical protein
MRTIEIPSLTRDANEVKVTFTPDGDGPGGLKVEWTDAAGDYRCRRFLGMSVVRIKRVLDAADAYGGPGVGAFAIAGLIVGLTLDHGGG